MEEVCTPVADHSIRMNHPNYRSGEIDFSPADESG